MTCRCPRHPIGAAAPWACPLSRSVSVSRRCELPRSNLGAAVAPVRILCFSRVSARPYLVFAITRPLWCRVIKNDAVSPGAFCRSDSSMPVILESVKGLHHIVQSHVTALIPTVAPLMSLFFVNHTDVSKVRFARSLVPACYLFFQQHPISTTLAPPFLRSCGGVSRAIMALVRAARKYSMSSTLVDFYWQCSWHGGLLTPVQSHCTTWPYVMYLCVPSGGVAVSISLFFSPPNYSPAVLPVLSGYGRCGWRSEFSSTRSQSRLGTSLQVRQPPQFHSSHVPSFSFSRTMTPREQQLV